MHNDVSQSPDPVQLLIESSLARIIRAKGLESPVITHDTRFLTGDLPIDSLDLAVVVAEVQEATAKDPFADGFVEFETVGELSELFR